MIKPILKNTAKLFIALFALSLPAQTQAAGLYMTPHSGTYGPGDTFAVDILINVDRDCINVVDVYLEFPQDYLDVKDFLIGESIINLWIEKPSSQNLAKINQSGVLNFSGGIPGGYCGRIPGDPGQSNLLGRIIFELPTFIFSDTERDVLKLKFLDNTRVLLNDGFGTADDLLTEPAEFIFSKSKVNAGTEWSDAIETDKTPPEPFVITLQQKEDVFDGQYYIIFATQDKQSGMDHFQVLEIRPEEEVGQARKRMFWEAWFEEERAAPQWQVAEMPYLLTDQTLMSKIRVMAVDKAGNERVVEYIPTPALDAQKGTGLNPMIVVLLLVMSLLVVLTLVVFLRKIISKKTYEEDNK